MQISLLHLAILVVVCLVVGGYAGLLIGRKNPKVAVSAQDVADAVNKAVRK